MPGQCSLFFGCIPRQEPGQGSRWDIATGMKLSSTEVPVPKQPPPQEATSAVPTPHSPIHRDGWRLYREWSLGWPEACRDIQTRCLRSRQQQRVTEQPVPLLTQMHSRGSAGRSIQHRAPHGNRTDAQHEGQRKSSLQMSTCHLWILMRADQQLKCIHAPLVIRERRCRRRAHAMACGGTSGSAGPGEVW